MNNAFFGLGVQVGLIVVPVVLFVGLKTRLATVPLRLAMAVVVALLGGALTYYLAARHGWRPTANGGRPIPISPTVVAAIHATGILITCVVLSVVKPRPPAGRGKR